MTEARAYAYARASVLGICWGCSESGCSRYFSATLQTLPHICGNAVVGHLAALLNGVANPASGVDRSVLPDYCTLEALSTEIV